MLISSFFPGRVRLRAPVFKDDEICAKALSILQTSDAVKSVERNPVTGSILLMYDTKKVPMDKLVPMQKFFMSLAKEATHFDIRNRQKILDMLDELKKIVSEWKDF